MRAGATILNPVNMQQALFQIDLVPSQRYQLRDPERVPECDKDQGAVTVSVSASLASSVYETLYFIQS
jgi:hypothetical protein